MSTAILVAGMHRSGTSATTGALRMCGVGLGGELVPAAADNRLGYWENARAVAIHEQLLAELERSWDDVRALPAGWLDSAAAARATAGIEALIDAEFAAEPLWAVKDPRICRFLPLWKQVLARRGIETVVLMVGRRPSEVAASIQSRNSWMPALSELLWLRHVLEAERDSRDLKRCVVTYDEIIASPGDVMFRALERLGVALRADRSAVGGELEHFISRQERHHRHAEEAASQGGIAEQAFEALEHIARDNRGWEALSALTESFEADRAVHSVYVEALADAAWKLRKQERDAVEAAARLKSDLYAQIEWSEQAVLREAALQTRLAEGQADLNAQIQWSEQAVQREAALQLRLAESQAGLNAQIQWSNEMIAGREKLYEELAQVRSDLNGQTAWSEEAVRREHGLRASLEELQARHAALQASLEERRAAHAALQASAEEFRLKNEGLIAENSDLRAANQAMGKQIAAIKPPLLKRLAASLGGSRKQALQRDSTRGSDDR